MLVRAVMVGDRGHLRAMRLLPLAAATLNFGAGRTCVALGPLTAVKLTRVSTWWMRMTSWSSSTPGPG